MSIDEPDAHTRCAMKTKTTVTSDSQPRKETEEPSNASCASAQLLRYLRGSIGRLRSVAAMR